MMANRRDFLRGLAAMAGAAAGGCTCACGGGRFYALQLYSIHKIFWKNPERILAALKDGGYDGVEFYNYNGMTAKALGKMCADAGLKAMGTHLNGDVDLVGDGLKKTLDYASKQVSRVSSLHMPSAIPRTATENSDMTWDLPPRPQTHTESRLASIRHTIISRRCTME